MIKEREEPVALPVFSNLQVRERFMVRTNRFIALAILLAAIPLWLMAGEFPGSASEFPRVVLFAIAILAVVLLTRSFLPAKIARIGGEGSDDPRALLRPFAAFATALIAVTLMPFVGFFPVMAAMAVILFLVLDADNRRFYTIAILLLLVMIYIVFVVALDVPLLNTTLFD